MATAESGAEQWERVNTVTVRPECGVEITYKSVNLKMPRFSGIYKEHIEEFVFNGAPAYQIIRTSDKMISRVTLNKADLAPIAVDIFFHDKSFIIQRRYSGRKVRIYMHEQGKYAIDVTREVRSEVIDPSLLGFELQGYPFEKQGSFTELNVLSARLRGRSIKMKIKLIGEELVKTPAGEFDCYRLDVSPSSIIRYLIKPGIVWFSKEKPHRFVKLDSRAGKATLELMSGPIPCDNDARCAVHAEPPGPIKKIPGK